jgi:hypothetical protein
MASEHYDFTATLAELDAGLFLLKLSRAVAESALAVAEHGDKGRKAVIKIELTLERIGDSRQLELTHKLAYSKPTRRGKTAEEDITVTPLYVTRKGELAITPDTQLPLFSTE